MFNLNQNNLIKYVIIDPNCSLRVLSAWEKLIVAAQSTLSVNSDITDSVDVVASYVELT